MDGVGLLSWFVAESAGAYGDQVLGDASPHAAGPQAAGKTGPAAKLSKPPGCGPSTVTP